MSKPNKSSDIPVYYSSPRASYGSHDHLYRGVWERPGSFSFQPRHQGGHVRSSSYDDFHLMKNGHVESRSMPQSSSFKRENNQTENEKQTKSSGPQKFDDVMEDWSGNTSLPAVGFIRQSQFRLVKLLWLFLYLAAMAGALYQLYSPLMKLLDHPIKTTISLGTKKLEFPTVTVCNVNPLRSSQLCSNFEEFSLNILSFIEKLDREYGNSSLEVCPDTSETDTDSLDTDGSGSNETYQYEPLEYHYGYDYGYEDPDIRDEYFGDANFEPISGERSTREKRLNTLINLMAKIPRETRLLMGHQARDTIVSCTFRGRECSYENFTTILHPEYGNCFQFNAASANQTKPFMAREDGIREGLSLVLFTDPEEYLPYLTSSEGFRVSVDHFETEAHPGDNGALISPGFQTAIGLRQLNMSRLGEPYWKCQPIQAYKEKYGFLYTQHACLSNCERLLIAQNCSCIQQAYVDRYPLEYRNLSYCDNTTQKCVNTVMLRLAAVLDHDDDDYDLCNCNPACDEINYRQSYSMIKWPQDSQWPIIRDETCTNSSDKEICRYEREGHGPVSNLANVIVYYSSMNYEIITEEEDYTFSNFGSDIGGTLGLWTGFCIFTSVELVALLVYAIKFCVWTRPRQARQRREVIKAEQQNGYQFNPSPYGFQKPRF